MTGEAWTLKRLAWAFGCAKAGSEEEAQLRARLLAHPDLRVRTASFQVEVVAGDAAPGSAVELRAVPSPDPDLAWAEAEGLDMPPDGSDVGFRHRMDRPHPCDFACGGRWVCIRCRAEWPEGEIEHGPKCPRSRSGPRPSPAPFAEQLRADLERLSAATRKEGEVLLRASGGAPGAPPRCRCGLLAKMGPLCWCWQDGVLHTSAICTPSPAPASSVNEHTAVAPGAAPQGDDRG